ncbi:Threonine/homoserine efflux transporter RhtA [Desulfonispora thiosulfatigenes DSM 11270]|uniref:Threonine/homoserine efflux transporter RhtA n=1 Tax=Desulfonispora thiosulfatigenes DSM 11270 TaxID=656914 RepID=A0A1W1UJ70_DESTI|nr:DMT family transporter [Desulfonispora thiosulfatigenes]SMB81175.1 Threonine/homoserine efflux transporter RhtA [Desulfonispora thiosulfatigenes DSM 11270]
MKYAILVFLAGCSYGMLSTLVKLAYGLGFNVSEVVGAQYYFGLLVLSIIMIFMPKTKLNLKTALSLMLVGAFTALTGIFYSYALKLVSATLGVVLLFQFTWIGVLIEAIVDKTFPSRAKLLSLPFLFMGTLMAGGVFALEKMEFNLLGTLFGLLAALTFATFIFLASRIAIDQPTFTRTYWIALGAVCLVTIVYPPKFLVNGALVNGLFKYGLVLGVLSPAIAPLLFAMGAPKTGSGLATILSSSELPVAILMSSLILREQVSLVQWLGIFTILLGIASPYIYSYFKQQYTSKSLLELEKQPH